jgi:hypothetical protein
MDIDPDTDRPWITRYQRLKNREAAARREFAYLHNHEFYCPGFYIVPVKLGHRHRSVKETCSKCGKTLQIHRHMKEVS